MQLSFRPLVLFGILVACGTVAYACSCAPPPPPKESLEAASAVFSGKVLKIEDAGEFERAVTLEVKSIWKGVAAKTVTIRTASDGAICGYSFVKGKSYLVYAREIKQGEGDEAEKLLTTNICSRTTPLEAAEEDLKALGAGTAPEKK